MTSLNPRITRNKDGSATLSGVPYLDLCHILTLATLEQYRCEDKLTKDREPKVAADSALYRSQGDEMMAELVEENLQEERIFTRRIRAILTMLKEVTSPTWKGDDGPVRSLSKLSVKRRIEDAKSERHFRHSIDRFIREAIAKRDAVG